MLPMLIVGVVVYFACEQFPSLAAAFLIFMIVAFVTMLLNPAAGAALVLTSLGLVAVYLFLLILPWLIGFVFGAVFLIVFIVSLAKLIGG